MFETISISAQPCTRDVIALKEKAGFVLNHVLEISDQ